MVWKGVIREEMGSGLVCFRRVFQEGSPLAVSFEPGVADLTERREMFPGEGASCAKIRHQKLAQNV